MINITNEDNMQLMSRYPDKYFDLAIVDPEYGINAGKKKSYHKNSITKYPSKNWDSKPPDESYFKELFRVSKNQIIWGGNYFADKLPISSKWIVWDKKQPEGIDQAMMELAWQSQQKKQSKIYRQSIQSACNKIANNKRLALASAKIHPTQKPVKLYEWLLINYAEQGYKILDTHGGSMSIALAVHNVNSRNNMNLSLVICELDEYYYNEGKKRYLDHIKQKTIFDI